jgi:hypothetical protein
MAKRLYVEVNGVRFRPTLRLVGDRDAPQQFSWVHRIVTHDGRIGWGWQMPYETGACLDSVEDAIAVYLGFLRALGAEPVYLGARKAAVWTGGKK